MELCKIANTLGYNHDFILFTDNNQEGLKDERTVFLGFDVCGDSMDYSYLGDGMFEKENYSNLSASFKIFYKYFSPKINKFILFNSKDDAQEFSDVLNEFTEMGYAENEINWRPISIYRIKCNQ